MPTNHNFLKSLFVLIVFFSFQNIKSQDTLILRDGKIQIIKITEINENHILYYFHNDSLSPLINKSHHDISRILLFNGSEYFYNPQKTYNQLIRRITIDTLIDSPSQIVFKESLIDSIAISDAYRHYKPNGQVANVFLSTVVLTPIGGAIVSSIINKRDITKTKSYKIPESPYNKSSTYITAYQNKATVIRQNKTSSSFAAGLVAFLFLFGINFNFITNL